MTETRKLETVADFRQALVELLQGAQREVCIFSEHLPRPLYHCEQVAEALSAFARSSRFARVRILIRDSAPIVRQFHRVHALAQRLSSRIQMRKIQATVDTPDWEFAVADGRRCLQCDDRDMWIGRYSPQNQVRGRQLLEAFEQEWGLAQTDINLRHLSL